MENKLMLEMPSPNVTKMIPLDFGYFSAFMQNNFIVTPHKNGIFEFQLKDPYGDFSNSIHKTISKAFVAYKDYIYDVGVTGVKDDPYSDLVGSTRFCAMDYGFAEFLTRIIKHRSAVDIIQDENGDWMEMVNVSQYFRFMKYKSGGEHFPHYDSDFYYNYNDTYTKYTVVVYFTKCQTGQIAFIDDKGTEFEGKTTDWTRQATDNEIYLKVTPAPLKIVAFPHTLCHTVLPFTDKDNERIICRGDILYRRCKV